MKRRPSNPYDSRTLTSKEMRKKGSLEKLYAGDQLGRHIGDKGIAKAIRELHRDGWEVKDIAIELDCQMQQVKDAIKAKPRNK